MGAVQAASSSLGIGHPVAITSDAIRLRPIGLSAIGSLVVDRVTIDQAHQQFHEESIGAGQAVSHAASAAVRGDLCDRG